MLRCHVEWSQQAGIGREVVYEVGMHSGKTDVTYVVFGIPISHWFSILA